MYTIIINKDKSLMTSIKTPLLHNTTTDEINFLYTPETAQEPQGDAQEEQITNPTVEVETYYTGFLRYENDNVMKSDNLITNEEPYKGKIKFVLPRGATFFSSRGLVQLWLEIITETKTTTTTYDPDTGEVIDVVVETSTEQFTTLPTNLFIEEVPIEKNCPWHRDDNNTIRITRGDSLTINVTLTDNDGFPYEPVEGDEVWFRVKKSANAENILIEKQIDINNLVLDLVEADTKDLAFGEYKYEIEVITTQDDHYTVIKNAPFIITEELH